MADAPESVTRGGGSAIQWCESTLNPWTGCTKVSPGCAACYIVSTPPFRINGRRFVRGHIPLEFHLERLDAVVRRKKPTVYFVNSLSDVFHEDVPLEALAALWSAMARSPQHIFQILTKRPERINRALGPNGIGFYAAEGPVPCPQPNVWLGCTVENRQFVGRADLLRDAPAAVRFLSCEPLLGPVVPSFFSGFQYENDDPGAEIVRTFSGYRWEDGKSFEQAGKGLSLKGIDWCILGGESGPGARRMDLAWAYDLLERCRFSGTLPFVKQLGAVWARENGVKGKAGDPAEWPEDLRVREMPPLGREPAQGVLL